MHSLVGDVIIYGIKPFQNMKTRAAFSEGSVKDPLWQSYEKGVEKLCSAGGGAVLSAGVTADLVLLFPVRLPVCMGAALSIGWEGCVFSHCCFRMRLYFGLSPC